MTLTDVHGEILKNAVFIISTIMAVWGLWRFFRGESVDGNYLGAVVISALVYIFQALYGLFLFITGTGELARPEVHILYGSLIVLVLPAIYVYTRGDNSRRTQLLYALAFIFVIGISFRSIATGI